MKYRLFAAAASVAMLASAVSGAEFSTATDQSSGGYFNDAIWGDPAAAPTNGNTYRVLAGGVVRSQDAVANSTFLGDALILDAGATLKLRTPASTGAIVNGKSFVLNGGSLINDVDNAYAYVKAPVSVTANSTITMTGANRWTFLEGSLTGTGNLTATDGGLVLSGINNDFHGNWDFAGAITVRAQGDGSLGNGNINVGPSAILEFGYDLVTPGTITIAAGGKVFLNRNIIVGGLVLGGTPVPAGTYTYSDITNSAFAPFVTTYVGSRGSVRVLAADAPPILLKDFTSTTVTVPAGGTTTFAVKAAGVGLAYEWYVNSALQAGETTNYFTLTGTADATVQCTVRNANGSTNSATAAVIVAAGPVVTSVANLASPNHLVVTYSKAVDMTTALNTTYYTLSGGIQVTQAITLSATKVALFTTTMLIDTEYQLTVANVKGADASSLTPDPTVFTFKTTKGGVGYYFADFNNGLPSGAVYGYTHVSGFGNDNNQILKLTDANGSQTGTWMIGDLGLGTNKVSRLSVKFKVNIGGSATTPFADGFCFSFGSDLANGAWSGAEEGASANGLNVMFDTYDNGSAEAPAVDVKLGGVILGHVALSLDGLAQYPNFVDVSIELASDGKISVYFGSTPVVVDLPTSYTPMSGRFGFGGRTGGSNANQWIDDLLIDTYYPAINGPIQITAHPQNATRIERESATFTASATGSLPITYQWKTNGVAVAGATNSTFTMVAPAVNGVTATIPVTVDIANAFGTSTSDAATLTVDPDVTAPTVLSITAMDAPGKIKVLFSEPVTDDIGVLNGIDMYLIDGGASVQSAALSSDGKAVYLTVLNMVEGMHYNVSLDPAIAQYVEDLSGNVLAAPYSVANMVAWINPVVGVARWDFYSPLSNFALYNNTIPFLTNDVTYPYNPLYTFYTNMFSLRQVDNAYDAAHDGAHGVAILTPTVSGEYGFYYKSDDAGRFWLSTDENPANKVALITENGCCNDLYTNVTLQAGKRYFMEAMYENGTGGDYITVQWAPPGEGYQEIPAANLSYGMNSEWFNVNQPTNITILESRPYAISVVVSNWDLRGFVKPVTTQWERYDALSATWTNIPGATGFSLPINTALTESGAQYRFTFTFQNGTIVRQTAPITLTVETDMIKPTLVAAAGEVSLRTTVITFDKPMQTSTLEDVTKYTFSPEVMVHSAVADPTGYKVTLTTSRQDPAGVYTVTVQNVADNTTSHNVIADGSSISYTNLMVLPFIRKEFFNDCGGGSMATLLAATKYVNNTPDETTFTTFFEIPDRKHPDFSDWDQWGGRLTAWFIPWTSGNYRFYAPSDDDSDLWLSTDANPANVSQIAYTRGWADGQRNYSDTSGRNPNSKSALIALEAGKAYFMQGIITDGGGGGYLAVAGGLNDDMPANGSDPLNSGPGAYLGTFVWGAPVNDATTITITTQPTDVTEFENGKATFTVVASGNPAGLTYQWQRWDDTAKEWTNIVGALNATYQTRALSLTDDQGAKIRCFITNPNGSFAQKASAVATLTVEADVVAPWVANVTALPMSNKVMITFSEPVVWEVAGNSSSWVVTDSNNVPIYPTAVRVLPGDTSYMLEFDSAVSFSKDQTYRLQSSETMFDLTWNNTCVVDTNFTGWYSAGGMVQIRRYLNSGTTFTPATLAAAQPNFPFKPDAMYLTNSVDAGNGIGDLYATAIRGYFIAPETANYKFAINVDDGGAMYLSTGPDWTSSLFAANKQLIIDHLVPWTGSWFFQSPTIPLVAGVPYYMEIYHFEQGGGDGVHVSFTNSSSYPTWNTAELAVGNMTSNFIAYAINPAESIITVQPTNTTGLDGTFITFNTLGSAQDLPVSYQWQRLVGIDWTNVVGATSPAYRFQAFRPGDNGAQFRCIVTHGVYGAKISDVATLDLLQDNSAPTIVKATPSSAMNAVTIQFSKPMSAATIIPANFTMDNGGVVLAAQLTGDPFVASLTTTPMVPGIYTITVNNLICGTEAAVPIAPNSTVTITNNLGTIPTGDGIRVRRYDGFGGTDLNAINNVRANAKFPNSPNLDIIRSDFYYTSNPGADNYLAYLSGYFVPSVTGSYKFQLTSHDDGGQIWLSTDADPAHKVLILGAYGCCGPDTEAGTHTLTAGVPYYMEAFVKEGGGGDNIDVRYSLNSGSYVRPAAPALRQWIAPYSITFNPAPASQNGYVGSAVELNFAATGPIGLTPTYQWFRNGTGIPGATNKTYISPIFQAADLGATYNYTVVGMLPGYCTTSAVAVVQVIDDTRAPALIAAAGTNTWDGFIAKFNKTMDPATIVPGNFTVDDGVTVLAVALQPDGVTVIGMTTPMAPTTHTLTTVNVRDASPNANVLLDPGSSIAFINPILVNGNVRFRRYDNFTGTDLNAINAVKANAKFPNSPSFDGTLTQFYYTSSPDINNYMAYLSGYFVPPTTGNYKFRLISHDDGAEIWLSSDATVANKSLILGAYGCCGPDTEVGVHTMIAGKAYYIEGFVKEGGGGDNIDIGYAINGGSTYTRISSPLAAAYAMPNPAVVITFTNNPLNGSVTAGQTYTMTVGASATPANGTAYYQWQRNGVDIPGANGTTYTTPKLGAQNNGDQYRAYVMWGNVALSTAATITVTPAETEPPQITKAVTVDGRTVVLGFSEPVYYQAVENPANYTITADAVKLSPLPRSAADTVVGFPATYGANNAASWPMLENPAAAMDGTYRTKFLSFAKENTGVKITLGAGAKAINAIRLTAANDAPERDPASMIVEGSVDGTTFTQIASVTLETGKPRGYQQTIPITDPTAYAAYKITFPTLANSATANSMQIAEIELLARPTPQVLAAALSADQMFVTLTLNAGIEGNFTIGNSSLADLSGNVNATASVAGKAYSFLRSIDTFDMVSGNATDPTYPTIIDYQNPNMAGDKVRLIARGNDIWGNQDGLNFIYHEYTGDFDVRARMDLVTSAVYWSKAGLMVREVMERGSRDYSALATPARLNNTTDNAANRIQAVRREVMNSGSAEATHFPYGNEPLAYPNVWVRLVRVGSNFYALDSTDGNNWTLFDSRTYGDWPARILMGIATTGNGNNIVTNEFSNYQVKLGVSPNSLITLPAIDKDATTTYTLPGAGPGRTFTVTSPATLGNLTIDDATGLMTYVQDGSRIGTWDFSGNLNSMETFTFVVNDPVAGTTFPITVKIPIVLGTLKLGPVLEDNTFVGTLLGAGPDRTLAILDAPIHGAWQLTGDQFTFVPDANFNGTETFSYTVTDAASNVIVVNVDLAVTMVEDAQTRPAIFTNDIPVYVAPGAGPAAIVAGDFIKDFKVDLVVANKSNSTVTLLKNLGAAGFTNIYTFPVGSTPVAMTLGDFDGDRKADLAVLCAGDRTVKIYKNNGANDVTNALTWMADVAVTAADPVALIAVDLNKDTAADLAVVDRGNGVTPGSVQIFMHQPLTAAAVFSFTNTIEVGVAPSAIAAGVLGKPTTSDKVDLVVANAGNNNVSILAYSGFGIGTNGLPYGPVTFATNYDVGTAPMAVEVVDINGDKLPDFVVANMGSDDITVYTNASTVAKTAALNGFVNANTFGMGTPMILGPRAMAFANFDNDRYKALDAAVVLEHADCVMVLYGNGTNTLTSTNLPVFNYFYGDPGSLQGVGTRPVAIATADFNVDRLPDAAVANSGSDDVSILLNNWTPKAYSMKVTVVEDFPTNIVMAGSFGPLNYIITQMPTNGTITPAPETNVTLAPNAGFGTGYADQTNSQTLYYEPFTNRFGRDLIKYYVSDGVKTSRVASITITLLAVNDQPAISNLANGTLTSGGVVEIFEDAPVKITNFVWYANAGPWGEEKQRLSYFFAVPDDKKSLFKGKAGLPMIIGGTNRVLSIIPTNNAFGETLVEMWAKDSGRVKTNKPDMRPYGECDTTVTQTFTVRILNVNDAPKFANLKQVLAKTILEDGSTNWMFDVRDIDSPIESLNFTLISSNLSVLDQADVGAVTWDKQPSTGGTYRVTVNVTPKANANGIVPMTFRIDDGTNSSSVNIRMTVTAVNDQPTLKLTTGAEAFTIQPGLLATKQVVDFAGSSFGPANEAAQKWSAFKVTGDTGTGFFMAPPTVNALTGVMTLRPVKTTNTLTATLKVVGMDSGGVANGGANLSAEQTIVVTIAP